MSWRPETLSILNHPHPALRFESVPVPKIDARLRETVAEMFELMYTADGIGLAANQVGIPRRLFVVNLSGGERDPAEEFVFINPTITSRRGSAVAEEGCLSLPGVYGDVRRPEAITVQAYGLDGQPFEMKLDDLPARVVQHETDHLDGRMFIDRMSENDLAKIAAQVEEFEIEYAAQCETGKLAEEPELVRQVEAMARA